ncbi:unnamed protein product [Alopecurus aequalis]
MGRGRIKLQFIQNRARRNRSQKMRLPNLVKSAEQLAVLCDAPTCLIAYPPGADQPVVFPSKEAAAGVLRQYDEVGETQRSKHKLDGVEFVQKMVEKSRNELYNLHLHNCQQELNLVLADYLAGRRAYFHDLPPPVNDALKWKVQKKDQAVKASLQEHRAGAMQLVPFEPAPVQPPPLMMAPPSPPNLSTLLLQDDVQDPVDVPIMVDPPAYNASGAPMTLDGEPRHGSYLFEVLDACDVNGDGSGLPTNEELQAVFVKAGISTAPQPNPSFYDPL